MNDETHFDEIYFRNDKKAQNPILKVFGISQNPNTKDYIAVFQYINCENCTHVWCTQCHMDYLKRNFSNWTSENNEIDNCIQTMQLRIDNPNDMVFEWI